MSETGEFSDQELKDDELKKDRVFLSLPETIRVDCLGNRVFDVDVDNTTTVEKVTQEIRELLELTKSEHHYGLFTRDVDDFDIEDALLVPSSLIYEVIAGWQEDAPQSTQKPIKKAVLSLLSTAK